MLRKIMPRHFLCLGGVVLHTTLINSKWIKLLMRKRFFILTLILCVLACLCACNKIAEVTVVYIADEGGSVYGNLSQTIEAGRDCTQVYAVAEEGYRFVGWDDGVKSSHRLDTNVEESKTITAQFEKIEYITVKYIAGEGGSVYGNLSQTIEAGQDCTQVYAVAGAGYRFMGWDDGVKSSQRLDASVKDSKEITARFEEVMVLFFSDDVLVRRYALNEFKTIDSTKIVAYASARQFYGWEFIGVFSGYNNEDPLNLLKTYFITMSDLADISLRAVFSDIIEDDESVPLNSKTIAHALGGVDNKSYLNSKEAFETNYNKGFRFFEADLTYTSDKKVVLNHNLVNRTYDEYMSDNSNGFTPLSLSDIFDYLYTYNEIWFDFDTARFSNSNLAYFVDILDKEIKRCGSGVAKRIIVEIMPWNKELIPLLKNLGITNFLYTEDWYTLELSEIEDTCRYCSENGIQSASIAYGWLLKWGKEGVDILKKYGIRVYAYTTSDLSIMYQLYDIGVDCIFTDFTRI